MTAQITILNKNGVAIATDSAVTISNSSKNNNKVYNTANKLFSLSNNSPIAIMVYGSAQFMGIPWETIIKLYRKERNNVCFNNLENYCNDFIKFICSNEILISYYSFDSTLFKLLSEYLMIFLTSVGEAIGKINANPSKTIIPQYINSVAEEWLQILDETPFLNEFDETFIEKNSENYYNIIEKVIKNNIFIELDEEIKIKIHKLLLNLLAKDFFTSMTSGLVITGYGEDELFPSLFEYSVEGIFDGKLKYKLKSKNIISANDLSENSSTALIKAFAQIDTIDTFIKGADYKITKQIFESVHTILHDTYPRIISDNLGIELTNEHKKRLASISDQIYNKIKQLVSRYQYDNFTFPIINTVEFMPKEEMAIFAETLVHLSSIKKKVTMDTESIGGPIDVAIVSKTDGFIWIKRKHYFNSDLNYRYFKRIDKEVGK